MDHFGGAPDTHPVLACASEISESLKAVAQVDPDFMSLADRRTALLALSRLSDQVEALKLRVVAACDEVAEEEGARSVADWLAAQTRRDRPECARTQRLATAMAVRPVLASGLAEGRVNVPQAEVIVRALDQLGPQVRPRAGRPGRAGAGRPLCRVRPQGAEEAG